MKPLSIGPESTETEPVAPTYAGAGEYMVAKYGERCVGFTFAAVGFAAIALGVGLFFVMPNDFRETTADVVSFAATNRSCLVPVNCSCSLKGCLFARCPDATFQGQPCCNGDCGDKREGKELLCFAQPSTCYKAHLTLSAMGVDRFFEIDCSSIQAQACISRATAKYLVGGTVTVWYLFTDHNNVRLEPPSKSVVPAALALVALPGAVSLLFLALAARFRMKPF